MPLFERAPRTTALVLGLGLLVVVEGGLRLAGVGDARDRPDPFAGFSKLQTTFVPAPGRAGEPARLVARNGDEPTRRFLAKKPADGFRVFVFGGSTEAGTPYGYGYAFGALLERQLAEALPDRTVEVVNCAVPGYASRRLLYLAEEVAAYEPDLFLISTGHNELIEQRVYAHLFDSPIWLFDLRQALRRFHITVLLEDLVHLARAPTRPEIDTSQIYLPMFGTRLDPKLWSDEEERDPEQQRHLALAMFRNNLERMIHVGREAGARVLLLSQTKNYADWAVTSRGEPSELTAEEQRAREEALARADAASAAGDAAAERAALEAVLALDPRDARVHQRLADLQRAAGEWDAARASYHRAHNLSLDRFGTTPARNALVREIGEDEDTLWLDAEAVFEAASDHGLVGDALFADFLHPNLAGHRLLAASVFETLRTAGVPEPAPAWREPAPLPDPEALYARHPELRAQELRTRILGELISDCRECAARYLEELRALQPDAPDLPRIQEWVEKGPPTDLGKP